MPKCPRRRIYFVDKKVQGALLIRIARYWLLSVVVVIAVMLFGWLFLFSGISTLAELREQLPIMQKTMLLALLASLLVLPIILLDLLKLSNRFAGPMLRLHRSMRQVAKGQQVNPVLFRDGDYWQEYADSFNELLSFLEDAVKSQELLPLNEPNQPQEIAS